MREKTITMPPLRAMAPPERPVPAPRPTIGVSIAIGEAHDPGYVARWFGKTMHREIPIPPSRRIRTASDLRARTRPPWAPAAPRVRE